MTTCRAAGRRIAVGVAVLAASAIPAASAAQAAARAPNAEEAAALASSSAALATSSAALASSSAALATSSAALATSWTPKQVTQYLPDTNHSQYDAVVVEPGQAWFFGGSNVAGSGVPETALRSNGSWANPPPALPAGLSSWIVAASGTSASDIWAATFLGGSVLHWDGSAWSAEPNGGWNTADQITGITATSPTDVWLFGASGPNPGAGTWHLSGSTWTQATGAASGILKASAAGPAAIWAIGSSGGTMNALVHFDGLAWTRVRPTALAGFKYSDVLTLSPTNVWVAGSVAGTRKLGHFNGHVWTALAAPVPVAATGLCRDGAGGLWVIANAAQGPSVVFDRSAAGVWTTAKVSPSPANAVLACAAVPGSQAAWGAGKAAPRPGATGTAAAAYGAGNVP